MAKPEDSAPELLVQLLDAIKFEVNLRREFADKDEQQIERSEVRGGWSHGYLQGSVSTNRLMADSFAEVISDFQPFVCLGCNTFMEDWSDIPAGNPYRVQVRDNTMSTYCDDCAEGIREGEAVDAAIDEIKLAEKIDLAS